MSSLDSSTDLDSIWVWFRLCLFERSLVRDESFITSWGGGGAVIFRAGWSEFFW